MVTNGLNLVTDVFKSKSMISDMSQRYRRKYRDRQCKSKINSPETYCVPFSVGKGGQTK